MTLYRKKPIVISAFQFWPPPDKTTKLPAGVVRLPPMTVDARERRGITYDTPARHIINTLEGQMQVNPGDWVVTGIKGERYPVRDDIFHQTYERVIANVFERSPYLREVLIVVTALVVGSVLLGYAMTKIWP